MPSRATQLLPKIALPALILWLGIFTLWSGLPGGAQLDWDYFNSLALLVRSSVLHYHRLPIHDPWVFGGIDVLANPQNRLLSPFFFLDLALSPPLAHVLSITILTFLGGWGTYRWLRETGSERDGAWVGAFLFINSSWFGLHLAEGHVPFSGILLLPWAIFFATRLNQPRRFFGLAALYTFWILDGAMYAVGLSLIALIGAVAVGEVRPRLPQKKYWPTYLVITCAALALASAKLIPLLTFYAGHDPFRFYTTMDAQGLWDAFFSPRQSPLRPLSFKSDLRFHEFGCYIGIVGFACGLLTLIQNPRRYYRHALWILFLLWVGSDWFHESNPWHVFEKLPVIGTLRVQSRVFVILHLFWVFLISKALSGRLKQNLFAFVVSVFLITEGIYVKNVPFQEIFRNYSRLWPVTLMTHSGWKGTLKEGVRPQHYIDGEWGSKEAYEPVHPVASVYEKTDPEYRGEIYFSQGSGTATIDRVEPGFIQFSTTPTSNGPTQLILNFNALNGWKSSDPTVRVSAEPHGRILVTLEKGGGTFSLQYRPEYLWSSVCAYVFGLMAMIWVGREVLTGRFEVESPHRPEPPTPDPV